MKNNITLFLAAVIISIAAITTSCKQVDPKTTKTVEEKTTLKKILERGYINVGTTGKQFPFSFKNESGELQGVDINLAKKLASELEVDIKFVELDINQLIPSLLENKIDLILSGFSITTKRNTQVLFTSAYYETGKAILTRIPEIKSGKKEFINQKAVTLVTINNSSSLDFIKKNYPEATVITAETIDGCKDILFTGKADGYVGDYELCESLFFSNRNNGDYNFKNLGTPDNHEYIGAAVAPGDVLLYNILKNFLRKVDKDSQNEEIETNWLQFAN